LASIRVAEWAYEQTERANGQVWLEKAVFQHLGPEWRRLVERVDYDGKQGTLSITFHPAGIQALAEKVAAEEEAA
jgi:hypothetical protein